MQYRTIKVQDAGRREYRPVKYKYRPSTVPVLALTLTQQGYSSCRHSLVVNQVYYP